MTKYKAIRTIVDGVTFASKREAHRYMDLKLLLRGGKITDLKLQAEYPVVVNGKQICKYISDFQYYDKERKCIVVEDSKGIATPLYRLKRKLVEAIYDIEIVEV